MLDRAQRAPGDRNISAGGDMTNSVAISGDHAQVSINSRVPVKEYIIDFTPVIEGSMRWFVGRQFIFAELENFSEKNRCGYFLISADAGLGKTSISAAVAKKYDASVFFLSALRGLTHRTECLNHLTADLILRYELPYEYLPARAGENATFFSDVLLAASKKSDKPIWLVIDALDETDDPTSKYGNVLLLPDQLPPGIFILLTHRPGDYQLITNANTPRRRLLISWDDDRQQADIEEYLRTQATENPAINEALSTAQPPVSVPTFVDRLSQGSAGNFMYLSYVLGEISRREEGYSPLNLDRLPQGLMDYYAQFWARMEADKRSTDRNEWSRFYRPIIGLLGVAAEPLTIEWFHDHTKQEAEDIKDWALVPWQRFLSRAQRDGKDTWRIIHKSFADFIAEKLDLSPYHFEVAQYYVSTPESELRHNGYAYRNVSAHLRRAASPEASKALFELLDRDNWYRSQLAYDSTANSYKNDVEQAWAVAGEEDKNAISRGQRPAHLHQEVKCALLMSSTQSFFWNLPTELLVALVTSGHWAPFQAWRVAEQNPSGNYRYKALAALSHLLEEKDLEEALESVPLQDDDILNSFNRDQSILFVRANLGARLVGTARTKVLSEILDHLKGISGSTWESYGSWILANLPELIRSDAAAIGMDTLVRSGRFTDQSSAAAFLLRKGALDLSISEISLTTSQMAELEKEAFDQSNKLEKRLQALATLAPHQPATPIRELLSELLNDESISVWIVEYQEAILALLQRLLELGHNDEVMKLIRSFPVEKAYIQIIPKLVKYFDANFHSELIEHLDAMGQQLVPEDLGIIKTYLRAAILPYLSGELKKQSLDFIFHILKRFGSDLRDILDEIAPNLPDEYLPDALDAARVSGDQSYVAILLAELAANCDSSDAGAIIREALRIVRDIPKLLRPEPILKISATLKAPLRAEILDEATQEIEVLDTSIASLLVELASELSEEQVHRLIKTLSASTNSFLFPRHLTLAVLARITPTLQRNEIAQEALDQARLAKAAHEQSVVLQLLSPILTLSQRMEAIQIAISMDRNAYTREIFEALLPYMTVPEIDQVISHIHKEKTNTAYGYPWNDIMVNLIPYLMKLGKSTQALEIANSLKNPSRIKELEPIIGKPDMETRYLVWTFNLRQLMWAKRSTVIENLTDLLPFLKELGGTTVMKEIAQVLVEIQRRFP